MLHYLMKRNCRKAPNSDIELTKLKQNVKVLCQTTVTSINWFPVSGDGQFYQCSGTRKAVGLPNEGNGISDIFIGTMGLKSIGQALLYQWSKISEPPDVTYFLMDKMWGID